MERLVSMSCPLSPLLTLCKRGLWPERRSNVTKGSVVHKTTQRGPIPCQDGVAPLQPELCSMAPPQGKQEPEPWITEVGGEDSAHELAQRKVQACRPGPRLSAIADHLYDLRHTPSSSLDLHFPPIQ